MQLIDAQLLNYTVVIFILILCVMMAQLFWASTSPLTLFSDLSELPNF